MPRNHYSPEYVYDDVDTLSTQSSEAEDVHEHISSPLRENKFVRSPQQSTTVVTTTTTTTTSSSTNQSTTGGQPKDAEGTGATASPTATSPPAAAASPTSGEGKKPRGKQDKSIRSSSRYYQSLQRSTQDLPATSPTTSPRQKALDQYEQLNSMQENDRELVKAVHSAQNTPAYSVPAGAAPPRAGDVSPRMRCEDSVEVESSSFFRRANPVTCNATGAGPGQAPVSPRASPKGYVGVPYSPRYGDHQRDELDDLDTDSEAEAEAEAPSEVFRPASPGRSRPSDPAQPRR